jgi:alpha-glucosidase (family GH31 glycosyl hydrolase)
VGTHLSDLAGFTADTGGALNSTLTYEFYTGTQSDILNDYTSVTGRPQLPPKWAFGLWMSANEWNTQAKVNTELAKVTSSSIPHTVMVLEQWSDEATFYLWKGATYTPTNGGTPLNYSDLTFPTGSPWTDPKSMVDAAHAQGIHMVLWQVPVLKENFSTNPSSAPQQHLNDKAYAAAHGYLVGDGTGSAYRIPSSQWFGDSTMPDFTNAASTSWWMGKRAYLFNDVGIDGMKTDGSEMIFGRNATFSDGRKGDEMHNAYPNAYTKAYSDFVQTETGNNGVLFSRAGTSGAQSNSIFWAGDQSSTFTSFQDSVRAGQSAGESGVPFWTWDMAGFTGNFPSSELYLRSAAQETFSPMMQYHSEKADPSPSEERTPWNVQVRTGDTTVMPIFTKFANVRMNLIPYLYTSADESASTGVPMMRAMSLAVPGDTAAAGYDQQYMLGSQLLVAPLTTQGQTTKSVYLPAGEWYDFWNGGRAIGGAVKSYSADTSTIPVYAKSGAVIPLNLNADYEVGGTIGNDVNNYANLAFRIYPSISSSYSYFEDSANAHRTIGVTSDRAAGTVTVNFPPLTTKSTLQVSNTKPSGVTAGGTALTQQATLAGLKSATTGWYWDQVQQLTHVKVGSSTAPRSIVLSGVDKAAYEAEFGTQSGVSTNTNHAAYTGIGFVDGFDALNDAVQLDVQADATASTKIQLRYANATGSTATRTIKVDGATVGTVSFPSLANWDTWGTATLTMSLTAGKHTIRVEYASGNSGAINLDNIVLSRR